MVVQFLALSGWTRAPGGGQLARATPLRTPRPARDGRFGGWSELLVSGCIDEVRTLPIRRMSDRDAFAPWDDGVVAVDPILFP